MLKFLLTDVENKTLTRCDALSVTINKDVDVPCDDMVVVFPYFSTKELKSVIVSDDDKIVFTGVVDEHITQSSKNGQFIQLVCRSMAANLVDNESVPVSYNHPTTTAIVNNHVLPFGVLMDIKDDATYFGVLTVRKGTSNWGVVEDFCKLVYNKKPYVNEHAQLVLEDADTDVCVFSNNSNGIPYHYFRQDIRRCEQLSKVNVKVINSCGYNNVVKDDDAINRGITKERYLNSVLTDTPAVYAKNMIDTAKKKAFGITLCAHGRYLGLCSKSAVIKDSVCGDIDDLYVSSIKYSLKQSQETTTFVLKRKEV